MVEELTRSRLGRGIAALIGDVDDDFRSGDHRHATKKVPIEFLRRNPHNPRRAFDEAQLSELADSIRERGVIQPLIVRAVRNLPDVFEIIAGERRWRAAQRAGLHEIPVVVVEADDRLALELAIVENVQRSDLNPLEEASGYERLIAQHGYTQAELGTTLGKSRSHIANTLRLLKLPEQVRDMLSRNDISAGHARALLAVSDPGAVAEQIVARGLTVRDVEQLGRDEAGPPEQASPPRPRPIQDPDTRALQSRLQEVLGLVVKINHKPSGGELKIRYSSLEQLEAICRSLQVEPA